MLGRGSDLNLEKQLKPSQAGSKQLLNNRKNRETDTARFKSQKSVYSSGSDFNAIKDIADGSGAINLPKIVRAEGAKRGNPTDAPYDTGKQPGLGRYGPASPAQTMSGARNGKSHDFEMVQMPATPGARADDDDSMAHRR